LEKVGPGAFDFNGYLFLYDVDVGMYVCNRMKSIALSGVGYFQHIFAGPGLLLDFIKFKS
jgi:hypothetical protein